MSARGFGVRVQHEGLGLIPTGPEVVPFWDYLIGF